MCLFCRADKCFVDMLKDSWDGYHVYEYLHEHGLGGNTQQLCESSLIQKFPVDLNCGSS